MGECCHSYREPSLKLGRAVLSDIGDVRGRTFAVIFSEFCRVFVPEVHTVALHTIRKMNFEISSGLKLSTFHAMIEVLISISLLMHRATSIQRFSTNRNRSV